MIDGHGQQRFGPIRLPLEWIIVRACGDDCRGLQEIGINIVEPRADTSTYIMGDEGVSGRYGGWFDTRNDCKAADATLQAR